MKKPSDPPEHGPVGHCPSDLKPAGLQIDSYGRHMWPAEPLPPTPSSESGTDSELSGRQTCTAEPLPTTPPSESGTDSELSELSRAIHAIHGTHLNRRRWRECIYCKQLLNKNVTPVELLDLKGFIATAQTIEPGVCDGCFQRCAPKLCASVAHEHCPPEPAQRQAASGVPQMGSRASYLGSHIPCAQLLPRSLQQAEGLVVSEKHAKGLDALHTAEVEAATLHPQTFAAPPKLCAYCCAPGARAICTRCMAARYCSVECQRSHWKRHQLKCK